MNKENNISAGKFRLITFGSNFTSTKNYLNNMRIKIRIKVNSKKMKDRKYLLRSEHSPLTVSYHFSF